jgi:hypothetical protein
MVVLDVDRILEFALDAMAAYTVCEHNTEALKEKQRLK